MSDQQELFNGSEILRLSPGARDVALNHLTTRGQQFATKINETIRRQVMFTLKAEASSQNIKMSEEELEDSDQFFNFYHDVAYAFLEGLQSGFPMPFLDE